jgi:hypothetical protein
MMVLRSGYALIELMVAISVTVLLLVVVLATATTNRRSADVGAIGTMIHVVIETVRAQWNAQADYTTVSTANVQALLPRAYRDLANSFGGSLVIAPAAWGGEANAAFDISLTLVPREDCVNLAIQLASQVDEIRVTPAGGATVVVKHGLAAIPAPDLVAAACSADRNTLIWRSL